MNSYKNLYTMLFISLITISSNPAYSAQALASQQSRPGAKAPLLFHYDPGHAAMLSSLFHTHFENIDLVRGLNHNTRQHFGYLARAIEIFTDSMPVEGPGERREKSFFAQIFSTAEVAIEQLVPQPFNVSWHHWSQIPVNTSNDVSMGLLSPNGIQNNVPSPIPFNAMAPLQVHPHDEHYSPNNAQFALTQGRKIATYFPVASYQDKIAFGLHLVINEAAPYPLKNILEIIMSGPHTTGGVASFLLDIANNGTYEITHHEDRQALADFARLLVLFPILASNNVALHCRIDNSDEAKEAFQSIPTLARYLRELASNERIGLPTKALLREAAQVLAPSTHAAHVPAAPRMPLTPPESNFDSDSEDEFFGIPPTQEEIDALRMLETVMPTEAQASETSADIIECPVCLDEITPAEYIQKFTCGHDALHLACFNGLDPKICPLCRAKLRTTTTASASGNEQMRKLREYMNELKPILKNPTNPAALALYNSLTDATTCPNPRILLLTDFNRSVMHFSSLQDLKDTITTSIYTLPRSTRWPLLTEVENLLIKIANLVYKERNEEKNKALLELTDWITHHPFEFKTELDLEDLKDINAILEETSPHFVALYASLPLLWKYNNHLPLVDIHELMMHHIPNLQRIFHAEQRKHYKRIKHILKSAQPVNPTTDPYFVILTNDQKHALNRRYHHLHTASVAAPRLTPVATQPTLPTTGAKPRPPVKPKPSQIPTTLMPTQTEQQNTLTPAGQPTSRLAPTQAELDAFAARAKRTQKEQQPIAAPTMPNTLTRPTLRPTQPKPSQASTSVETPQGSSTAVVPAIGVRPTPPAVRPKPSQASAISTPVQTQQSSAAPATPGTATRPAIPSDTITPQEGASAQAQQPTPTRRKIDPKTLEMFNAAIKPKKPGDQ